MERYGFGDCPDYRRRREVAGALTTDDLPAKLRSAGVRMTGPISAFDLASVEKLHIQPVLIHTRGNKTEAARLLNIGLSTLYRKIEEYKLTFEG